MTTTGESDSQEGGGGWIPGAPGVAAFVSDALAASAIPVLIAAPHGGRVYPASLLRDLRVGESGVLRLEDRYIDIIANAVARATGASLLVAHAPRTMIDLNRAPDDLDWEMFVREARPPGGVGIASRRARSGLGLIPRRLPGTGELWRRKLEARDLAERIAGVHEPYHAVLAGILAQLRARWGAALLIDLHSMPPLAAYPGTGRAQVVLGDRFGAACHGAVVASAFAYFAQCGRETAHNRPYAGGYVLERHADPRGGVHAIQVEIDRSRYLDAAMVEAGPGIEGMIEDLSGLVRRLASVVADMGRGEEGRAWPLAAE